MTMSQGLTDPPVPPAPMEPLVQPSILTPERLEGETFEQYKARRRLAVKAVKAALRGSVRFCSKSLRKPEEGSLTYRKDKHGRL